MKFKYQYIFVFMLAMLTACQDETFQSPLEESELPVVQKNEIFLKREYAEYILAVEKLAGLEGCRIHAKEGFVFLSDSVVRSGQPLIIEVEQNPYEEERRSELEFTDQEDTVVRSFSLRQASSLSQTQGEAYSGALQRSYGVGYGYDAFGEYASYNSVRDQVISLPALRRYEQEHKTACIVDDFSPDMETTILEGNDSRQLLKSFSAHAGLGLNVGFFQAHVEGKYSRSDLKTNAYSFCTIMNNYKAASRHIEPYSLVEIVRNNPGILTEGFRNIENKISNAVKINNLRDAATYTEELFRIYGTHLIYHADLGGKLEFCSTFERAGLDSQTTLSVAAEASFLNMCGFKMEEGQTNTYSQTSTRQSRSISARGGDVTYTTEILNCEKDVLASGLVDRWYQSVCLDFNDPKRSNVELIDFKLFPIYEFITDVAARNFIYEQLGIEIEYEDSIFPRVYDKKYVRIDLNRFFSKEEKVEYLKSGNETIIETVSEFMKKSGKQYKFRSLYPVLAGEVRREGIAVAEDSIYRILWKDTVCTLAPIGERSQYPVLYYDDGDLEIMPADSTEYATDYTIHTLSLYAWDKWYDNIYKYGPYMIMAGPTPSINTSTFTLAYDICYADSPTQWGALIDEYAVYINRNSDIRIRDHGLEDCNRFNGYYIMVHINNKDTGDYKYSCSKYAPDIGFTFLSGHTNGSRLLYVRTSPIQY